MRRQSTYQVLIPEKHYLLDSVIDWAALLAGYLYSPAITVNDMYLVLHGIQQGQEPDECCDSIMAGFTYTVSYIPEGAPVWAISFCISSAAATEIDSREVGNSTIINTTRKDLTASC